MAMSPHYSQVQRILLLVLGLNWAVALAKLVYGLASNSSSMTADGYHSLADGTSNVIGLVGIALSARPKDENHPYGHQKYETLFALGIAAMLLMVALNLVREGVRRLGSPVVPRVDAMSFVVMLATMAVNVTVMTFEYRRGRRLHSDLLIADSMHTRADLFTSFSVLAALVGVKLGYPIIDPIVTLVIAVFVLGSAFGIIRQASRVLVDEAAIANVAVIEQAVLQVEGVKSCHKIRSRGRLDDVHLDLHVQVDGGMTLYDSHRLSHAIAGAVRAALPQVTDVLVHVEPQRPEKPG